MKYLLLRDNKQSGPYAFEELKAKGLKPYDLVWVEGRSAAWRYPSEIDELRAFAPAVEEQPFDRFFKKPGSTKSPTTSPSTGTQPVSAIPPAGKRNIYVTMPGSATGARESFRDPAPVLDAMPAREPVREPEAGGEPDLQTGPVITARIDRLLDGQAVEAQMAEGPRTRGYGKNDVQAGRGRLDYRAPRAGYGGEPVAEILPPLPRRKANRAGQLALVAMAALVVLAAGIFIGISIRRDNSRLDQFTAKSVSDNAQPGRTLAQQLPVQHAATDPANQQGSNRHGDELSGAAVNPAAAPSAGGATQSAGGAGQTGGAGGAATAYPGGAAGRTSAGTAAGGTFGPVTEQQPDRPALTADQATGKSRRAARQKTGTPKVATAVQAASDSGVGQPVVIHREAAHRTDVAEQVPAANDKESAKIALANQVSVGANKFEVGTFGGIRNLQVTVSNRSAFALDLVVVEISFVQANKKIYKTENLYFRDIGPGSALMLEAPKTSRGINIQYKITSINSKQLGLSQPGT